jgi:hypothetical protein
MSILPVAVVAIPTFSYDLVELLSGSVPERGMTLQEYIERCSSGDEGKSLHEIGTSSGPNRARVTKNEKGGG